MIRRLVALCSLVVAARAAADPAPMAAGALPAPASSDTIALVREDLAIDVTRRHAVVTAALWLENGGPEAKLDVGFPCDAGGDPGVAGLDCKTKIDVRVDGKKVVPRLRKATDKQKHWMWPMRFAPGQKVKVDVAYRARLYNDRYETPYFGMGTLYYRLATGARWAGKIAELNMRVDMPTDALVHVAPAGFTREHGRVSWSLRDVEPSQDVAILVHPMMLGRYAAATKAETRAELVKAIEAGTISRDKMAQFAKEWRGDRDEMIRYAHFFQDVARKKLGLPAPTDDEVKACLDESARLIDASAK